MNKNKELSASEAIFAFCGWLSTRNEETVFSKNDCAVFTDRIKEFLEINNLPEPRPGWESRFEHPPGENRGPGIIFDSKPQK